MLDLKFYPCARDFLQSCGSFLEDHEAENNLIIGLASSLEKNSSSYDNPFFASVGAATVTAAFMRTPPHRLILSKPATTAGLDLLLEELIKRKDALPGVLGPAEEAEYFTRKWLKHTGGSATYLPELVYKASSITNIPEATGSNRLAQSGDIELLTIWMNEFSDFTGQTIESPEVLNARLQRRIQEERCHVWEVEGVPVSVLQAVGDTPNGIRIGFVYTPEKYRRNGYASALVGVVSSWLLSQGKKYCFLFTDAGYEASNKIYQRLGYEMACEFRQYDFSG